MNRLEVRSPFSGRLLKRLTLSSKKDAERMLRTAKRLFEDRNSWLPHSRRIAILERLASLIEKDAERFSRLIAQEGGKPLADARVEVARAIDGVRLAVKEIPSALSGQEIPMGLTPASHGRRAWTTREPIGVVVAVSAFNHPLNLIIHQAVPAIAVGCPVIIKPAETTPLNCLEFAALVKKAGLPEGWLQVCISGNEVAEKLVTDPRIAFFSFIGSARVGWMLRRKLAPGVRCALEHGGCAPVIIDKSADFEGMIAPLLKGGFYHAGQVCVSVQRVFAPHTTALRLARRLAAASKKLKVGDPAKQTTQVGPLILKREVVRVHEWVKDAVKGGAKLLSGGRALSDRVYAPTVLFDPPMDAKVSTAEIFGPVICVYPYRSRLAAIRLANSLDVAFQASVFSSDITMIMDTVSRLDASTVMVNDHTAFRVDWMPFGGRRSSGIGIGGIGHTMADMTQTKLMVIKS